MSKSNKSVREMLERTYGKKCMVHEGIRKLKAPQPKKGRYKGKSIAYQLTLHHLKPLRKNGATTKQRRAREKRELRKELEEIEL